MQGRVLRRGMSDIFAISVLWAAMGIGALAYLLTTPLGCRFCIVVLRVLGAVSETLRPCEPERELAVHAVSYVGTAICTARSLMSRPKWQGDFPKPETER
jgi:hypothetical protein